MPIDKSIRSGGKLYDPLVAKAVKVITRMTTKWGVKCDVYYCKNELSTLDVQSINTNELKYNSVPDLPDQLLCLPAFWENLGANDFNFDSHEAEEIADSIYTLPSLSLPLLCKVVIREEGTNRAYIVRKIVLEHINRNIELFLQYYVDIMPTNDTANEIADLKAKYEDKSIFNPEDNTDYLPAGVTVSKL